MLFDETLEKKPKKMDKQLADYGLEETNEEEHDVDMLDSPRADGDAETESEIDSDSDEEDMITESKSQELAQFARDNPTNYNAHTEHIKAMRSLGDPDGISAARELMYENFPMTEQLWQEWISDETRLAMLAENSQESVDRITSLFEKAVADYQSVDLWIEYCKFVETGVAAEPKIKYTKKLVKYVREFYEKATTAVGLHVTEGRKIWQAYRDFEVRASSKPDVILTLYQRELAIPLKNLDETFAAYEKYLQETGQKSDPSTKKKYEKASSMLEERLSFEEDLNVLPSYVTDPALELKTAWDYLDFELKSDDPFRVLCLYERLIKKYCLVEDLWLKYADYVGSTLKDNSSAASVCGRAVRNCPWSSKLWIKYFRNLERGSLDTLLENAYSNAIKQTLTADAMLEILLEHTAYQIRQARKAGTDFTSCCESIEKSIELLAQKHPGIDVMNKLPKQLASVHAHLAKNFAAGKKVYEDHILKTHGRETHAWLEIIGIARTCGEIATARSLYKRACFSVWDHPETLAESWLRFEREVGSLDDVETAEARTKARSAQVLARAAKEAAESHQELHIHSVWEPRDAKRKFKDVGPSSRMGRPVSHQSFHPPPNRPPQHTMAPNKRPRTTSKEGPEQQHDDTKTLFVSNIGYSVTEPQLMELFAQPGAVEAIRLMVEPGGKSKGFAYVQYKEHSGAKEALSLNGKEFAGRPLSIVPSRPKEQRSRAALLCYNCQKPGHRAKDCKEQFHQFKNLPKKEKKEYHDAGYSEGRPKPKIGKMVPRSVKAQARGTPPKTEDPEKSVKISPKTNSDFRAMFISK